jgi:site-specific recombinase XerD
MALVANCCQFSKTLDLGACQGKDCASFRTLATKATNVTSMAGKSTGRGNEDWLHGISLGPQSVVNYRAVVHAFFEHCVKRSLVERNPIAAIDKVKVVDKAPEILTPDQLFNLLSAAPLLQGLSLPVLIRLPRL